MLNQFTPASIDNEYCGHKLALWLFYLLLFMKAGIGLNTIFNGHFVASSADGLRADTFSPAGVQAVISLYAIWGVGQITICLLGILVAIRYRAMIPIMYTVFLLQHLGTKLVTYFLPIAKNAGSPGSVVNVVLLAIMIIGFALSLRARTRA